VTPALDLSLARFWIVDSSVKVAISVIGNLAREESLTIVIYNASVVKIYYAKI
jgi:hypothetical protein